QRGTRPGSAATGQVMMPNGVVLPAPFGPMMPSASPSASARSSRSAITMAPKRLEILSRARMEDMTVNLRSTIFQHAAVSLRPHPEEGARICVRPSRRMGGPGRPHGSRRITQVEADLGDAPHHEAGGSAASYDSSASFPPTGMFFAVSFWVMTRSNALPLRCHCPDTSGVLVTFFTGPPAPRTGPTIEL